MRRSRVEIYVHLVWATRDREASVVPEIEPVVHRLIRSEDVLALNGMPDHMHLVASLPATVCAAELAKQVKGGSSRLVNESLPGFVGFSWQEKYGVFSISRSHLSRVIAYVEAQKERHRAGDLWPEWEEADEMVPEPATSIPRRS